MMILRIIYPVYPCELGVNNAARIERPCSLRIAALQLPEYETP